MGTFQANQNSIKCHKAMLFAEPLVTQLVKDLCQTKEETWFDPWVGKIEERRLPQYSGLEGIYACIVCGMWKANLTE